MPRTETFDQFSTKRAKTFKNNQSFSTEFRVSVLQLVSALTWLGFRESDSGNRKWTLVGTKVIETLYKPSVFGLFIFEFLHPRIRKLFYSAQSPP
jgi:hypothetical protein